LQGVREEISVEIFLDFIGLYLSGHGNCISVTLVSNFQRFTENRLQGSNYKIYEVKQSDCTKKLILYCVSVS